MSAVNSVSAYGVCLGGLCVKCEERFRIKLFEPLFLEIVDVLASENKCGALSTSMLLLTMPGSQCESVMFAYWKHRRR